MKKKKLNFRMSFSEFAISMFFSFSRLEFDSTLTSSPATVLVRCQNNTTKHRFHAFERVRYELKRDRERSRNDFYDNLCFAPLVNCGETGEWCNGETAYLESQRSLFNTFMLERKYFHSPSCANNL